MAVFWTKVQNDNKGIVDEDITGPDGFAEYLFPVDDWDSVYLFKADCNEIEAQSLLRKRIGNRGLGVVYSSPLDVEKTQSHLDKWLTGNLANTAKAVLRSINADDDDRDPLESQALKIMGLIS